MLNVDDLFKGCHFDREIIVLLNLKSAGTALLARRASPGASTKPTSKLKGRWTYLYRAVDKEGKTVNVLERLARQERQRHEHKAAMHFAISESSQSINVTY
jgi:DDE domain